MTMRNVVVLLLAAVSVLSDAFVLPVVSRTTRLSQDARRLVSNVPLQQSTRADSFNPQPPEPEEEGLEAPTVAAVEETAEAEQPREEETPETAAEGEAETTPEPVVEEETPSSPSVEDNLVFLLSLGAITGRGEFADKKQREVAEDVISALEDANPTSQPTLSPAIQGRWELAYCTSGLLFRSSPFFMAGREVCRTETQQKQYNWFCEMHRKALAISNIGAVRQVISSTKLVSEFEVKAGAIPFLSDFTPLSYSGGLPFTIDGALVSTADLTPTSDGSAWELFMDTVQVKGSNVPGLRQVLDGGLELRSRVLGDFLEKNVESYSNPRPVFKTTYLDEKYRISRDQDGAAFLYVKTSDDAIPTDYSSIDSDLGVGRLLEGFNDAITQFYI
jgi:hypothetical protein